MRFLAVLLLLLIPLSAFAEEKKMFVSVVVTGDNKDQISSYVKRELRELNDVELIPFGDYSIYIVCLEAENRNREPIGFTLSWVVTDTWEPWEIVLRTLAECGPRSAYDEARTAVPVTLKQHIIQTIPMEDVKKACERLVAKFDTQVLEPDR